jgi:cardiolipin synthase
MNRISTTPWRHLPNLISLLRIALVVPVAWMILQHRYDTALWLALIAGLSDALDGWLARRFGWRSRLGAFLDPAADKLLLMTSYLVLAFMLVVPWWLTALVLGRDAVILGGALAYRIWVGPFTAQPRRLAKFCTLVQILYVLALLLRSSGFSDLHISALQWLVVVLTVASGLDYVWHWSARTRRQWNSGDAHHDA